ncbi:hypothetical protein JS528_04790 [Bifidobacterium sp. MA2]|uniref:Putative nitroreductase TM1586 domain-containing protein n=1 Tax=Bifidobacterium santillanense TaxID=2809028 RepID=A0ABS5UP20_9BIFI|nr:nitroreductase family protein [Bifidobacterium santillanense]MBT1172680.1 hypothetical protein [Bifidobacterium santillanense]
MTSLLEAIDARHAIRAYTDEPVAPDVLAALQAEIDACNAESGLHIQMAAGLDDAFLGLKTHYGRFKGVHNAIALVGAVGSGSANDDGETDANGAGGATRSGDAATTLQSFKDAEGTPVSQAAAALQERVGYYGERLVLRAVQLGLDTSWAVLDGAEAVSADDAWWTLDADAGESVVWVIAFGHGARPGGRRRTKPMEELASIEGGSSAPDGIAGEPRASGDAGDTDADAAATPLADVPDWFRAGMEAAMAAPTSLSQQPFHFTLHPSDGTVTAEALDGLFAHVGLGCAKYHFEIGAAPHRVEWR